MGYGRVNIADKAVPDVMDIRDETWERRSIFPRHTAAHKSLLNKDNLRMMAINISLKGGKLGKRCYSAGIPGDDM